MVRLQILEKTCSFGLSQIEGYCPYNTSYPGNDVRNYQDCQKLA
jgi:hypothetical protein